MIRDPYIGMPIMLGDHWNRPEQKCCRGVTGNTGTGQSGASFDDICLRDLPLAMAYVPMQQWNTTYPLDKALERATLFPDLDLPFERGMRR